MAYLDYGPYNIRTIKSLHTKFTYELLRMTQGSLKDLPKLRDTSKHFKGLLFKLHRVLHLRAMNYQL